MNNIEELILEVFRKRPSAEHSTTSLISEVFPEESSEIAGFLSSPDTIYQRRGRQRKARLHRRILYYLNKLVDDDILSVVGSRGRGEKLFTLKAREGSVEIRSGKKRIIIHKPLSVSTPIDSLDSVVPYHRESWIGSVNALLLDGLSSLRDAGDLVIKALESVNDVVGVLRTDTLLSCSVSDVESVLSFIEKFVGDKFVVFVISMPRVVDETGFVRFCRTFCQFSPKRVELVINVTNKSLRDRSKLLEDVIPFFSKHRVKLNIKNSSLHPPPVIFGNCGPYSLGVDDWRFYQSSDRKGLVIGGSSVAVDIALADRPLHELAKLSVRSLFAVNVERRRTGLSSLRSLGVSIAFINEYLRFWNFTLNNNLFFEELAAVSEVVNSFSATQERVYRACGMPIRFRVALSSSFPKFGRMSPRKYRKFSVSGIGSFNESELRLRERLGSFFIADRVRFFRSSGPPENIVKELFFLFSSFNLPFITYDFSELRNSVKLTDFLGVSS